MTGQPTLFATGPTARRSDPLTSLQAPPATSELHASILDTITKAVASGAFEAGLTDDELVRTFTNRCEGTVKKRRTELAHAGLVADSGITRPTRTGAAAIVWRVAP